MNAIREMRETDAKEVSVLARQLGYEATAIEIGIRWAALSAPGANGAGSANNVVLVATDEHDRAIAWMHLRIFTSLVADPSVEIAALVVDEKHRGQGIGARLVERAEGWARELGFSAVQLSSQTKRAEAHRFYE